MYIKMFKQNKFIRRNSCAMPNPHTHRCLKLCFWKWNILQETSGYHRMPNATGTPPTLILGWLNSIKLLSYLSSRTHEVGWGGCCIGFSLIAGFMVTTWAHLGPTGPGWAHVGHRNFAIWVCSLQARLRMYCVWCSLKYQLLTRGNHPNYWI